jgi:TPR repeat protein
MRKKRVSSPDRKEVAALMRMERVGENPRSTALLRALAECGHTSSQVDLANILTEHSETEQEGIRWYKRAAARNPSTAMFNLARTHLLRGKPRWYLYWMKKLADMGDEYAREDLSEFLAQSRDARRLR